MEYKQYIGKRTENGTEYPAVNLAGSLYDSPPNTVGLGGDYFAVLSLSPVDSEMIEQLKGHLTSGTSKEATDNAPKNKPARGVSTSGNVSLGGDDVSDPSGNSSD